MSSRSCFGVTLNCSQALVPKSSADPAPSELNESEMSAGKSRHSCPKTTLPQPRAAKNNPKQPAMTQPCFHQGFCTKKCMASSVLCLSWCPHSSPQRFKAQRRSASHCSWMGEGEFAAATTGEALQLLTMGEFRSCSCPLQLQPWKYFTGWELGVSSTCVSSGKAQRSQHMDTPK